MRTLRFRDPSISLSVKAYTITAIACIGEVEMRQSIVDWVELGRLIKIARKSYGYTRGLDLANAIEERPA